MASWQGAHGCLPGPHDGCLGMHGLLAAEQHQKRAAAAAHQGSSPSCGHHSCSAVRLQCWLQEPHSDVDSSDLHVAIPMEDAAAPPQGGSEAQSAAQAPRPMPGPAAEGVERQGSDELCGLSVASAEIADVYGAPAPQLISRFERPPPQEVLEKRAGQSEVGSGAWLPLPGLHQQAQEALGPRSVVCGSHLAKHCWHSVAGSAAVRLKVAVTCTAIWQPFVQLQAQLATQHDFLHGIAEGLPGQTAAVLSGNTLPCHT